MRDDHDFCRNKLERLVLMRRELVGTVILLSLLGTGTAAAEDELPRLGLSPAEPQYRGAAPSVPFGISPAESGSTVLDIHGFLLLPLRVGVLKRVDPGPGQAGTTLHTPPNIPQELRRFEYTGVVPTPWVQLNLSFGNKQISATAIIAAEAVSNSQAFIDPGDQLGVSDAYLTVNLEKTFKTPVELKVGSATGRYGIMGEYDAGRYATPIIARTNAIGELINVGADLGNDFTLVVEQGLGGQLGRPPDGLVPAAWNDFADEEVGASFLNQLHAGLGYKGLATLGLHYLTAWSQDDRASLDTVPDGRITVLGGDLRLTMGRYGHLYGGLGYTDATNATTVGGIIEILNARGGPELIDGYLGPNSGGDGSLITYGVQYDLSMARLLYCSAFTGNSPDVMASAFAIGTGVKSDDPDFDGVNKLKLGAEVTYSMLSWFGASLRFDHVRNDVDDDSSAFSIISPRVLFHTDWRSRDEFSLQYSHFTYGGSIVGRSGLPPTDDPTLNPDQDVFSFTGTFWW